MLVYRIENADGDGAFWADVAVPYGDDFDYIPLAKVHDLEVPGNIQRSCYDGPSPLDEGGAMAALFKSTDGRNHYRFGCSSLNQLRTWFFNVEGCAAMARHGGMLATYEVPDADVVPGRQQVAFRRSSAVLVDRVPADQLHV